MPLLAGKPRAEQTLAETGGARYANLFAVKSRATTPLGSKQFVAGGIEDDARDHFIITCQSERHAEHREAMSEVRGAIKRIDVPNELA